MVLHSAEPSSLVYWGGNRGSFEESANEATKKMVLHLVSEHKLKVDDVNTSTLNDLASINNDLVALRN